ncbi:MAG: hypothetical protein ACYDBB_20150 [Armatimonadota bacterium]
MRRYAWFGMLGLLVLVGLMCGCNSAKGRGNANLIFSWPTATQGGGQIVGMQSLTIAVSRNVAMQTVNRPTGSTITTLSLTQVPARSYDVTATAYAEPDGKGVVLGVAYGTVTIVKDQTATVMLTTVVNPQATFMLTPDSPTIQENDRITFRPRLLNPDGSIVLLQPACITWESNRPDIATITPNGEAKGIHYGTSTITVRDQCSGKTASTTLHVVRPVPSFPTIRPPIR